MNTADCIKAIVAFLLWYIAIGSVDCYRHCVACMRSYGTCNSTSRTCKSNCFQKKTCPSGDDLCLATWVITHTGLLLMFTDCFPRPPYSGHTKYTRYCEGKELNDTVTCLCSRNGCNRRVFRPPKVAPAKQDVPRVSGNVTTHRGTVKGNTPSESSANTPVFVCIASLAVLILVFLFVYGTGQRKTNANPAATIQSGTESTANNQKQQKFILQRQLARGRFGDVWNASFEEQTVAVKLFSHWAVREYQNERDFFMNSRTDHSNILQFIAAGEGVLDGQTEYQYWLVTEYCHKGSLRDYLKSHLLSWEETLVFLHSISSGVAYLHADWLSERAKIPVAHRDLKSANILVKENGTCVLADFDSATALNCAWAITNNQVGTYRYMSPEELDASVNLETPDAFKQMDVYSMALVLWEVTSRCTLTGPCGTYELPYQFAVGGLEPDLDKMIKVVVQQNRRPPLNWKLNEGMETLCETIQDCWDSDPEARLTADCTRARITDLLSHTEKPTYLRIV